MKLWRQYPKLNPGKQVCPITGFEFTPTHLRSAAHGVIKTKCQHCWKLHLVTIEPMAFQAFNVTYAASMSLLPAKMNSPQAKAMLIAIALQESRFQHRRQIKGPARGFWQFELGGGVRGVLNNPATKDLIGGVLDALVYDRLPDTSYAALEHNDVLACCYARLLLWTLPEALPGRDEADEGWAQYLEAWRPGKPHVASWGDLFARAWTMTDAG